MAVMARRSGLHYAWVIVGVTFLALLASSGVRAAPAVLIVPFEAEFGWDRASISLAAAASLITYGLGAPLGGSLIGRFGTRRVMLAGLALIAAGVAPLIFMRELWQLHLLWGLVAGIGTGAVAQVIGATIAITWFQKGRGVVIGLFGAATSAGQLIFLPTLVAVTAIGGWRASVLLLAAVVSVLLVPVALLLRDRPSQMGLEPYGRDASESADEAAARRAEDERHTPLRVAVRTRDFQLLAASFFICGYTSTDLDGTDRRAPDPARRGARLLRGRRRGRAGCHGWHERGRHARIGLADRSVRQPPPAGHLLRLPCPGAAVAADHHGRPAAVRVRGGVGPRLHRHGAADANLTARIYGRASVGTLFGWIFFGHMVGAALAAWISGVVRDLVGDYTIAFISAAILGFIAVALALAIRPMRQLAEPSVPPQPAEALAPMR